MDVAELFESNLELIDRVIARVCHRAGVFGADAEDFASAAKLLLIENDYAVLRPFEGRSSLSTFLVIIIQRLYFDQCVARTGRWHASREAERLGEAGIALERIVRREHRTLDEALPIVQAIDPTLTRERLAEMESRLPARAPRPRSVDLEAVDFQLSAADRADDRVLAGHVEQLAGRAGRIVRETLAAMPLEDRMIVRFHFGEGMTIADISGLLRLPQRPLYRRVESLVKRLRAALTAAGIEARDAADLIGAATAVEMDLGLRNGKSDAARRTNAQETTVEEAG